MLPWQGLKPLPVAAIPITGRESASSVNPAPLMNAFLRKSEKPVSP
jgi:hypothetical protein